MKQNIKNFGINLLCLLTLVQLSGCKAASGIKPSQAVTSQFLQNMQAHQFGAAYSLLSLKCKTATTQQQLEGYWALVEKSRGTVKSWSQRSYQVYSGTRGSSVTLSYLLQCVNGPSEAKFNCVEESNKWLIESLNFNL